MKRIPGMDGFVSDGAIDDFRCAFVAAYAAEPSWFHVPRADIAEPLRLLEAAANRNPDDHALAHAVGMLREAVERA